MILRALLPGAVARYLKRGNGGILIPTAYHREKPNDRSEVGVAAFAFPVAADHALAPGPFDEQLGAGSSTMLFNFFEDVGACARDVGLELPTMIGCDLRPRLALGTISTPLMVSGPHVHCLVPNIEERDFIWSVLVDAGLVSLFHSPAILMEISESQLDVARGLKKPPPPP
jgi:hypothetical protein